ncbi:perivitellin-2 67 kDa subunit-like isoform X2 [Symsagittifera roscoffensis]|uniref:perivitellin-2 67 kDa subunit-like isoform X2 n=1 Tax=Symsagittifera roscoffensis TaxID=84072 RepID=UPI00307BBAC6
MKMPYKMLLIVLLTLLQTCVFAVEECSDTPEGLQLFSKGVDISVFYLDDSRTTGFREPVFDFSCTALEDLNGTVESDSIPDQIQLKNEEPNPKIRSSLRVFRSFADVKRRMAERSGILLDYGKFSSNELYRGRSIELNEYHSVISEVYSLFNAIDVELNPDLNVQLGKKAAEMVANLSSNYDENPSGYQEFIKKFGTHYLSWARFGHFIKNQFLVAKEYHLKSSDQDIKDQSMKYFVEKYRAQSKNQTAEEAVLERFNVSEEFLAYSRNHDETNLGRHFDGLPHKTSMKGLELISKYHWPSKVELKPIHGLIHGNNKRFSMFKAEQMYLQGAYLSDLEIQLKSTIARFEKIPDLEPRFKKLESLLGFISEESANSMHNYTVIRSIGESVKFNLIKPKWWQEIELCFEFESDEEDMYCSGMSPSCTKINNYTDIFKDWTRNDGGCSMVWYLRNSTEVDPWFKEVKICYKYYAVNSDTFEQCGNNETQENEEICSGFTENGSLDLMNSYYDHTDNRQGGCKLSWKLSVPENVAPNWFLNVKFCYTKSFAVKYFEEDMCAFVNEFTPEYLDDTYFRNYVDYRENYIKWGIIDYL